MSAELRNVDAVVKNLENRFGKSRMEAITDKALKEGGKVILTEIIRQMSSVRDRGYSKGYTIAEIKLSEPFTYRGVRTIKIHWKGPHNRYRIIHLNEWGTVKNLNPPLKGRIAMAVKSGEARYFSIVKNELARGL